MKELNYLKCQKFTSSKIKLIRKYKDQYKKGESGEWWTQLTENT